ncbi:MAG TPA: HigA family addiction module antitoxin [Candidatus Binataceae bacterium]|nr:HigA family addiction module antitoxin [Candidatus Binataceae bacterium]
MAASQILTHPGDILREELKARGLSANRFALDLAVPSGRIVEILNRKRGVSADTALRLSRYLGTSAQVWMNLQAKYDLAVAQQEFGKMISQRIQPAPLEAVDVTRSGRVVNSKRKPPRKAVRHEV